MIKTHTFRKVTYDIEIGQCDGSCDAPVTDADPSMRINLDRQDTLKFLETAIHESLHACDWKAGEVDVTETARDIARFLRRLGYGLKQEK